MINFFHIYYILSPFGTSYYQSGALRKYHNYTVNTDIEESATPNLNRTSDPLSIRTASGSCLDCKFRKRKVGLCERDDYASVPGLYPLLFLSGPWGAWALLPKDRVIPIRGTASKGSYPWSSFVPKKVIGSLRSKPRRHCRTSSSLPSRAEASAVRQRYRS